LEIAIAINLRLPGMKDFVLEAISIERCIEAAVILLDKDPSLLPTPMNSRPLCSRQQQRERWPVQAIGTAVVPFFQALDSCPKSFCMIMFFEFHALRYVFAASR